MKSFLKNKKTKRLIVIGVIALLLIVGVSYLVSNIGQRRESTEELYTMVAAENRDITVSLSGAGTLKPADSYVVTTLTSGDVLSAPFEEGDVVAKDAILFEVDSSSVGSNIETAEISLAESRRNYNRKLENIDDLTVRSDVAGTIVTFDLKVGDTVQMGQMIATVRNSSVMTITLPFGSEDTKSLSIGQSILVTVTDTYETLEGRVSEISTVNEVLQGGMIVNQVTIDVNNPGGLRPDHVATAMSGSIASFDSGNFSYKDESTVMAETSGDVKEIRVKEGDKVADGEVLLVLDSTMLMDEIQIAKNNLRRAQISLDSQYDALDNYMILSPIGGTVIEKNYKAGDKLESGKALTTIFDLSHLTMTLYIDELDIKKINVGQPVSITAEAVEDKTFLGEVTKVNINGITSGGTTTYPVTIQINQTDELLPGMNVDARIVIESKIAVLAIPAEAVLRGDRVLVKTVPGEAVADAPEGYKYLNVTTGISDLNFIEITEGLSLGDEVAIEKRVAKDSFTFGRPPQGEDPFEEEVDQP